jgi:hypothetical protein
MARCEDFPCCGHTLEDGCPDQNLIDDGYLPYRCLECGKPIKLSEAAPGHESFHATCLDNIDWDRYPDYRYGG